MKVCKKGLHSYPKECKSCPECEKSRKKLYHSINRESRNRVGKEYYESNKEKKSEQKRLYYEANTGIIKERHKLYKLANKKQVYLKNRDWYFANKEKMLIYHRSYIKSRSKIDIDFKLANSLRKRLYDAVKNNQKVGSAVSDLGCSIAKLKIHLQLQFRRNPKNNSEHMSWNNWATDGWHIDHIKPLSSFDLTNREELLEACHYTNLQPLWWYENLNKGNKYEHRSLQ